MATASHSSGDTSSSEFDCSSNAPEEVTLVVAGKSRAGKSTALNNIFELNLPAFTSATSVTQEIVKKDLHKHGATLHVVDTPGLCALDIKKESILQKITRLNIQGQFVLLLCLPVGPGHGWTENEEKIVKNLNFVFGKKIWDRCLILLPYSDLLRFNEGNGDDAEQKYIKLLNDHCQEMEKLLKEFGVNKKVVTVYEYKSEQHFQQKRPDWLVALPVAKNAKIELSYILPGLNWAQGMCWTDIAFTEATKVAGKYGMTLARIRESVYFIHEKKDDIVKAVKRSAIGTAITSSTTVATAGIGAAIGAVGGPVGALAGAGIGAGVGLTITVTGLLIVYLRKKRSSEQ